MAISGNGQASNILIIGECTGGAPAGALLPDGTPAPVMAFSSSRNADIVLRSGVAHDLALRAMDAGGGLIYVIRANPATPGTLILRDTNGNPVINLTATDWGAWTNNIKVLVETGTDSINYPGGHRITVTDTSVTPNIAIAQDNIWRKFFDIAYIGTGSTPTLTTTSTALTTNLATYNALNVHYIGVSAPATVTVSVVAGTSLTVTSATGGLETFTVTFTGKSIQQVADVLNASGFYRSVVLYGGVGNANAATTLNLLASTDCKAATPVVTATGPDLNLVYANYPTLGAMQAAIASTGAYALTNINVDPTLLSNTLDYQAATVITSAASVTAHLQAAIDFFNFNTPTYLIPTRAVGGGLAPVNVGPVYLVSGSDGTSTNGTWQTAWDASKNIDAQIVVLGSVSPTVQAQGAANADFMSGGKQGKMERRVFVGADNAETFATAMGNARTLADYNVCYVFPGIKDYDPTGLQKDSAGRIKVIPLPGYYAAATLAGIKSADLVQKPLTRASLRGVQGLQYALAYSELVQAEDAGVLTLIKDPASGAFMVQHAITTFVGQPNYARHEESVVAGLQYVTRSVRDAITQWITANRPVANITTQGTVLSIMSTTLRQMQDQGVIVGSTTLPAFYGLTATVVGDALTIAACVRPAVPINSAFIDLVAVPFSSTLTLSSTTSTIAG